MRGLISAARHLPRCFGVNCEVRSLAPCWLARAPGSTGQWLNSSITGGLIEDDCSVKSVEMGSM